MKNAEPHKNFLKSLERLLTGRKPGKLSEGADQELMDLAGELQGARPVPGAAFIDRMNSEVAGWTGMDVAGPDPVAATAGAAAASDATDRWWRPAWLTPARAAAGLAVLIVALGGVGLTRALISGGYTGNSQQAEITATSAASKAGGQTDDAGAASDSGVAFQAPVEAPIMQGLSDQNAGASRSEPGSYGVESSLPPSSGTGEPLPYPQPSPLPTGERVMQSATYSIEVPVGEFQAGYDKVTALAAKYGGYIVSAETRRHVGTPGDEQPLTGSITIRVSTAQDGFAQALAELDGIGTVLVRDVSGQDVTQEYVDLQSRLRNAQAQEAQLLALMQKAETIDEILLVQSRLSDVQSQIEQIKGRINYMDSRTDFATISVALKETGATEDDDSTTDTAAWGFVDALVYAGWLAVQSVNFVIMALGVIIPVALMAGLVFAGGRWLLRRRTGRS